LKNLIVGERAMPEVTDKKKSPEAIAAPVMPSKKKAPGLQFSRVFSKPRSNGNFASHKSLTLKAG
jgi:hypothetical protein